MPNIIIAISLFYLYAKMGLVGTNIGLILGHTVLAIPYVVIQGKARWLQEDVLEYVRQRRDAA